MSPAGTKRRSRRLASTVLPDIVDNQSQDDDSLVPAEEESRATINDAANTKEEEQLKEDEEWAEGWALWNKYRSEHGTGHVPETCEDISLLRWVGRQHEDYFNFQQGLPTFLGREGFRMLRRMGFVWNGTVGGGDVAQLLTDEVLGPLDERERKRPRLASTSVRTNLSEAMKRKLALIATHWDEQFEALKEFKKTKGHVCVPKEYPENQRLSTWVYQQRKLKRQRDRGQPSTLTDDRLAKLEEIGFVFNTRRSQEFYHHRATAINSQVWESSFQKLEKYREQNGNCLVPKLYPQDQSLSYWVARQRHQYRLLQEGKLNVMSPDRLKRLEDIGFVFNTKTADVRRYCLLRGYSDKWEDNFKVLLAYKKKHGHTYVPRRYQDDQTLAAWVQRQRAQYRLLQAGKTSCLTPDRLKRLEDIGFLFHGTNADEEAGSENSADESTETEEEEEVAPVANEEEEEKDSGRTRRSSSRAERKASPVAKARASKASGGAAKSSEKHASSEKSARAQRLQSRRQAAEQRKMDKEEALPIQSAKKTVGQPKAPVIRHALLINKDEESNKKTPPSKAKKPNAKPANKAQSQEKGGGSPIVAESETLDTDVGSTNQWVCAVCNRNSFETFVDYCAHEARCSGFTKEQEAIAS